MNDDVNGTQLTEDEGQGPDEHDPDAHPRLADGDRAQCRQAHRQHVETKERNQVRVTVLSRAPDALHLLEPGTKREQEDNQTKSDQGRVEAPGPGHRRLLGEFYRG